MTKAKTTNLVGSPILTRAEPTKTRDRPPRGGDRGDFQRFEDLTRKLVKVPKSEVDEKRKPS